VLGDDFTEENGTLTPSLKLKRAVVMKEFGDEVEALYQKDPAAPHPSQARGGPLQRGR
jgi:long-chain acyl-CoA synthetase